MSVMVLGFQSFAYAQEESRLDAYNKLRKVIGTVEKYYVDELTLNEIVDKAIDGMLSNLDAHSAYLDEKKYTYCKRITIGSDILSLDWIAKNYSKTEFTCKLSDRKKIEKYQQGA